MLRGIDRDEVMTHPQTITFGEMRASGARNVLIYYSDYRRSRQITINADHWPDNLRVSDIEDLNCSPVLHRNSGRRNPPRRARFESRTDCRVFPRCSSFPFRPDAIGKAFELINAERPAFACS